MIESVCGVFAECFLYALDLTCEINLTKEMNVLKSEFWVNKQSVHAISVNAPKCHGWCKGLDI